MTVTIDRDSLSRALSDARAVFAADPNVAVRSGRFIQPIHMWCAGELQKSGIPAARLFPDPQSGGYVRPSTLRTLEEVQKRIRSRLRSKTHKELRELLLSDIGQLADAMRRARISVHGGYLAKQMDVSVLVEDTGPLLAVSVKSQMLSIRKNAINRFEEYVGDSTNLHTRHPMLVLGFLLLLPVCEDTVDSSNQPTEALERIAHLLEQATGRDEPIGALGSYEASTLLLVDFAASTPELSLDFPTPGSPLRVEGFFNRLVALYTRRNRELALGK